MKRIIPLVGVLLVTASLFAQDDSVIQQSKDVLLFGIDSEVVDLLARLEDQGEDRLDQEILARFRESRNRSLQGRILEYFEERGVADAGPAVSDILQEDDSLDATFLRTAVRYLSDIAEFSSPALLVRYEEIARDDDLVAASVAIRAVGADASPEAVALLMDLYRDFRDVDLKGSVVRALGDAHALEALDLLTGIVTDAYEDSSLRQYGAESLGKIAAPDSLATLVSVLDDENSLLRAYATAALGSFDGPEAETALADGLRDSFWRVRVAALQGIANAKSTGRLAAVGYKARRDPESPVRQQAIRTLGAMESEEAYSVLREIASESRSPQADRMLAVQLLAENDLAGSMETIIGIIDSEWTVENSRLLDAVAQSLVRTESPLLAETYERLLSHSNFIIQVYAVRGIGHSGFSQFGDHLLGLVEQHETGIVRSTALAALDELGIPVPEPDDAADDTPGVPQDSHGADESRAVEDIADEGQSVDVNP